MANPYRKAARQAARRYGLPFFPRQIRFESGFRDVTSPAGAQGPAQLMPGTARSLGVNPHSTEAIFAAAKLMRGYVDKYGVEGALRAYNAGEGAIQRSHGFSETNAYVKRILGNHPGRAKAPRGSSGGGLAGSITGGGSSGVREIGGGADVSALLAALTEKPQVPSAGGLTAPSFSAQPVMPTGSGIPQSGGGPAPKPDVNTLLEAIRTVGGSVSHAPASDPASAVFGASGGAGGAQGGRGGGRVVLDPGADRPGVRTHRSVVNFAQRVSAIAGSPVRIGTGTQHSKFTVDGNVSDHWSGNAADIPATGRRLIRLGQAALIAAGMSPRQARKQRGGLYNVGGHQVIFNTHEGGDHTNHLHISARRR